MPYVPMNALWSLLRAANYQGKEGKRIVGCQENPNFNATSNEDAQFITTYDNGPKTASESW